MSKTSQSNTDYCDYTSYNKLREPLGEVVISFVQLEDFLGRRIGYLLFGNNVYKNLKIQRKADIVTAELSSKNKIILFSALYQSCYPKKAPFEELKTVISKLHKANNERNKLIHPLYTVAGKSAIRIAYSAKEKKGFNLDTEKVNKREIQKVVKLIENCIFELANLKPHA